MKKGIHIEFSDIKSFIDIRAFKARLFTKEGAGILFQKQMCNCVSATKGQKHAYMTMLVQNVF